MGGQFFHLWFMALPDTKLNRDEPNTSSNKQKAGSEPPAMGDASVLLEGCRVYERTMVQRNRATLPAGRTRPPHEVFIPGGLGMCGVLLPTDLSPHPMPEDPSLRAFKRPSMCITIVSAGSVLPGY
ncbi:hypothetical protein CSKR_109251 [Clonorchis sinensis]|uniref:Uncharacterized protein n=1 Tax=Clonorchis sinensis TaxID=79923 RepID=A0A419PL99_CLOSI|nr:hypothetical protein CSKR_109251 [Clonorchis sinensis]